MQKLLMIAALLATLPMPAGAQTALQVLRDFGVLGTWAHNCRTRASGSNSYVVYAPSNTGEVIKTADIGPQRAPFVFRIASARRTASDLIEFEQLEDGTPSTFITLRKTGNRIIDWRVEVKGGEVFVENGKYAAHIDLVNKWRTRCSSSTVPPKR
jgi:hypothetical protein